MKNGFIALLALLVLNGCSHRYASTNYRYLGQGREQGAMSLETEPLTESLFNFKERTISEADIQKTLNSQVYLPDSIRMAVLNLSNVSSHRKFASYSLDEDYFKTQEMYFDTVHHHLKKNGRLKKYMVMPSLVIGTSPNINTLRESAVRMQADALLIFTLYTDVYQKYKAFDKDKVKAYATAEVLLMDVRTGMVTHSNIVTKDRKAQKGDKDLTTGELIKRAQQEAILEVMDEVGANLNQFLADEKK